MKMFTSLVVLLGLLSTAYGQTKSITVDFNMTGVRDAFASIFKGTGYNYALLPGVTDVAPTITLALKNMDLTGVLDTVSKSYGLKYSRDKDTGVYYIDVKTAAALPQSMLNTITPDLSTVDTKPQLESIPLMYVDSVDIYNLLNGQVNTSNTGNTLGGMNSGGSFGNSGFGGGMNSGGFGNSSFGGGGMNNRGGFGSGMNSEGFGGMSVR